MPFDRSLIGHYRDGGRRLREAVAGLTEQQRLRQPADGSWTIQQIVIHLMESDLIGIDRMKRTIAEERPLLIGYDESAFARSLFPDVQPIEQAVEVFDLSRQLFSNVLERLPDETFDRVAIHNQAGKVTLAELLAGYDRHLDHHLGFIARKRA